MGGLTALLLATPIYGFALSAPALDPAMHASLRNVSASHAAALMQVADAADDAVSEAPGEGGSAEANIEDGEASKEDASQAEYKLDLERRNDIADLHRVFGISTWAAMTVTVIAGILSYHNLYGFFDDQGSNPCVTGNATFGDGGCDGMRVVHGASAGVTTVLYATTFTLSLMMPDPDDLSEGEGEFAKTLRLHKTLRWVHFGGMITQALIGIVMANNLLGLDRANDYGTLRTLATVHLASGLVTYGALTWAGALMTF